MFTKQSKDFGVLAVDNSGKAVKVFEGSNQFRYINVGAPVKEARWNGDTIIVQLESGKIRKYTDYGIFTHVN